ncbi:MAG: replicative DNA helicase [Polyangiaceae bacterium]|nr:replicative DNA helicase [Polyangiaceae bacterium]
MNESHLHADEAGAAGPVGRVPPHDLYAESAVLSAVLLDPAAVDVAAQMIRADDFYVDANRRIFEAVIELQLANRPVDMVSVAGWLNDRGRLQQLGGLPYLAELTEATPAIVNVEHHAQTIREKARLRRLIQACHRIAAEGFGDCGEVQEFIDHAEQTVFDIARTTQTSSIVPVKTAIRQAFDIIAKTSHRSGGITGAPTGFTRLDRLTTGLHPGELFIVAGRPGMGKTSFVLNVAVNMAKPSAIDDADGPDVFAEASVVEPGYGVAFFSLEMPKEQLAARLLAAEARVDVSRIRSGSLRGDDWHKLTEAAARLSRRPIWLDDTPALGLLELRAKIRRLQAEISRGTSELAPARELGLVAVDYLQLMQGRRDAGSREQEISELSRGLKQLAKEMNVPVLALSQLNRSVETRTIKDKRPQLSDLRESGAIEQDADCILFIYRDEYYFKDSPDKGVAEVIIAKQRNGPTDTVKTKFTSAYTRFDNFTEDGIDEYDQYADLGGGDDGFA